MFHHHTLPYRTPIKKLPLTSYNEQQQQLQHDSAVSPFGNNGDSLMLGHQRRRKNKLIEDAYQKFNTINSSILLWNQQEDYDGENDSMMKGYTSNHRNPKYRSNSTTLTTGHSQNGAKGQNSALKADSKVMYDPQMVATKLKRLENHAQIKRIDNQLDQRRKRHSNYKKKIQTTTCDLIKKQYNKPYKKTYEKFLENNELLENTIPNSYDDDDDYDLVQEGADKNKKSSRTKNSGRDRSSLSQNNNYTHSQKGHSQIINASQIQGSGNERTGLEISKKDETADGRLPRMAKTMVMSKQQGGFDRSLVESRNIKQNACEATAGAGGAYISPRFSHHLKRHPKITEYTLKKLQQKREEEFSSEKQFADRKQAVKKQLNRALLLNIEYLKNTNQDTLENSNFQKDPFLIRSRHESQQSQAQPSFPDSGQKRQSSLPVGNFKNRTIDASSLSSLVGPGSLLENNPEMIVEEKLKRIMTMKNNDKLTNDTIKNVRCQKLMEKQRNILYALQEDPVARELSKDNKKKLNSKFNELINELYKGDRKRKETLLHRKDDAMTMRKERDEEYEKGYAGNMNIDHNTVSLRNSSSIVS